MVSKASGIEAHKAKLVAELSPRTPRARRLNDLELAVELELGFRHWLEDQPWPENPNPIWMSSKRRQFIGFWLRGLEHVWPVPY